MTFVPFIYIVTLAKRKRVVLSLKTKCEVTNRLEHGEIMTKLTDEYVIGKSTIYDISQKKPEISDCVENSSNQKAKEFKCTKFTDDICLNQCWIIFGEINISNTIYLRFCLNKIIF